MHWCSSLATNLCPRDYRPGRSLMRRHGRRAGRRRAADVVVVAHGGGTLSSCAMGDAAEMAQLIGYVDFELLDDPVDADNSVYLPSDDFSRPPTPKSLTD